MTAPGSRRVLRHHGKQEAWIVFGGDADRAWLRFLRPGFRHCFAAIRDDKGWTVLEPLSGRLLVARLPFGADVDLPAFYQRAGLTLRGPFTPAPPRRSWLPLLQPASCVAFCRAVLGSAAPFALTPYGLARRLQSLGAHG